MKINNKKTYVIEDNKGIQEVMKFQLEALGRKPVFFDNYEWTPTECGIYICDYDIEGHTKNGGAWVNKHYKMLSHSSIIATSGNLESWVEEGIDGLIYLPKPADMRTLLAVLLSAENKYNGV